MRSIAAIGVATLMLMLVTPVFAQPFTDVPTTHWAFDAIAQLAAKGLIEGYPGGTFQGDRAMTRDEMAMLVARLVTRIESVQVPAASPAPSPPPSPPAPPITRVDIETIQRLVSEFRAELAALGVPTTAIEEELNAMKASVSNVRITGAYLDYVLWFENKGITSSLVVNSRLDSGAPTHETPAAGIPEDSGERVAEGGPELCARHGGPERQLWGSKRRAAGGADIVPHGTRRGTCAV